MYTYNVCYPIIGAYVYMYTGTLDKINTSRSVRNSACPLVRDKRLFTRTSKQSISSFVRQVKSYNHILFAFEVATVCATTNDSQDKHYQDHSKVIHNYKCLSWTEPVTLLHSTLMSSQQKPDCVLFQIICFDCYVSETQVGPYQGNH